LELATLVMNYRHVFHAGNSADVFKHAVLVLLLKALQKKEAPFCYLDTHAGAGRYDLAGASARRTNEAEGGIARLWGTGDLSPALGDYLEAVRTLNPSGRLRYYPGSPRLARRFLRAQDRMILVERAPEEFVALKKEFAADRQVTVQQQDGYAALKAHLPPKERRGLVLLDPPYEAVDEFAQVSSGLEAAHARWSGGVYAIWYPIKERRETQRFLQALAASGIRKILCAELALYPEDNALRLNGCGMAIVNPPWQLDAALERLLPELLERLRQVAAGRAQVRWLVPE